MPAVDTVIVGGGSAGCVLANRLSHDRGHRVLLVESGGPDVGEDFEIPARLVRLIGSERDWSDVTVPQAGLGGRTVRWPRGRALGGSSAINATLWVPPRPADFDAWRDDHGLGGWGWVDLLPALRRAEEVMAPENLRYAHELSAAFVEASRSVGLADTGVFRVTQRRGVRRSAASAYLRPAMARDNLEVRTGITVGRIRLSGERAVGVELADGSQVDAGRVIVAAGAVGSPVLLQRSGIGPGEHLRQIGIDARVDLPVGAQLADHLAAPVLWVGQDAPALHLDDSATALRRWRERGDGPLVSGNAEAFAFAAGRGGEPDLLLHAGPAAFVGDVPGHRGMARFTIAAVLLTPSSRGRVLASRADPSAPPLIDPGYLLDRSDLDALVTGVRLAERIAAVESLRHLLARRVRPVDDSWQAHVRARASTLFHPTGTVGAGRVLDHRLAVLGVAGLYVVDASVFPAPVRANTNATVLAVAERAAEMLTG